MCQQILVSLFIVLILVEIDLLILDFEKQGTIYSFNKYNNIANILDLDIKWYFL